MASQPNTNTNTNIDTSDPSEYIYVSKKHYDRKYRVENDSSSLLNNISNPGPVGALMIYIFDVIIEFIARIMVYMFTFVGTGFDYILAYTFGTFNGFFPSGNKNGIVVSYKFLRYIINIFLPPVGIYLSKGLYGWFNVIICFVLTYVHYVLGIIYCFIVTANNRYADLYEKTELKQLDEQVRPYKKPEPGDHNALYAIVFIIALLILIAGIVIWWI